MRRLIVENYIVFYMISEKDEIVMVIRILYSRRDWEHLL
ncbi:type II toxin-antitoxin system RelE/ParE family toxin [Candidatus Contubernalis alkaliaceticus]|nr:type II toxin-antitoxin system RelE/ParE family toxin [Candidatus Contubernalis alkalaceticus]